MNVYLKQYVALFHVLHVGPPETSFLPVSTGVYFNSKTENFKDSPEGSTAPYG